MDEADRAQPWEERERCASIELATHRATETPLIIKGERMCRDCHDPIAKKRIQAQSDAVRCADCASDFEKQKLRSW